MFKVTSYRLRQRSKAVRGSPSLPAGSLVNALFWTDKGGRAYGFFRYAYLDLGMAQQVASLMNNRGGDPPDEIYREPQVVSQRKIEPKKTMRVVLGGTS